MFCEPAGIHLNYMNGGMTREGRGGGQEEGQEEAGRQEPLRTPLILGSAVKKKTG